MCARKFNECLIGIIEKYNKPFENCDDIDLNTLEVCKSGDFLCRLPDNMGYGNVLTNQLRVSSQATKEAVKEFFEENFIDDTIAEFLSTSNTFGLARRNSSFRNAADGAADQCNRLSVCSSKSPSYTSASDSFSDSRSIHTSSSVQNKQFPSSTTLRDNERSLNFPFRMQKFPDRVPLPPVPQYGAFESLSQPHVYHLPVIARLLNPERRFANETQLRTSWASLNPVACNSWYFGKPPHENTGQVTCLSPPMANIFPPATGDQSPYFQFPRYPLYEPAPLHLDSSTSSSISSLHRLKKRKCRTLTHSQCSSIARVEAWVREQATPQFFNSR